MRLEWAVSFNKEYENIFACSKDYYGVNRLIELNRKLKQTEHLLLTNPYLGKKEITLANHELAYRSILLSKPFKLIYTISEDCIYLVDIWDTRREPTKLEERLK